MRADVQTEHTNRFSIFKSECSQERKMKEAGNDALGKKTEEEKWQKSRRYLQIDNCNHLAATCQTVDAPNYTPLKEEKESSAHKKDDCQSSLEHT